MPWREWARIEIHICRGRPGPPIYSTKREALSSLYANPPNLTGVSRWRRRSIPGTDEYLLAAKHESCQVVVPPSSTRKRSPLPVANDRRPACAIAEVQQSAVTFSRPLPGSFAPGSLIGTDRCRPRRSAPPDTAARTSIDLRQPSHSPSSSASAPLREGTRRGILFETSSHSTTIEQQAIAQRATVAITAPQSGFPPGSAPAGYAE